MIELHVIIDIDQTLIDSMTKDIYDENRDKIRKPDFTNNNQYVWVRPKVKEFFNYLDKNVKYISIWTNGSKGWLDFVVNNILSKYIPVKRFYILSCINNSTPMVINKNLVYVKEIGKLLKKYPNKNISLKNTVLVDDNYYNCSYNKYNSIPIKKFLILEDNKKINEQLDYTIEIIKLLKDSQDISFTLKNVYDGINDYDKLFSNTPP